MNKSFVMLLVLMTIIGSSFANSPVVITGKMFKIQKKAKRVIKDGIAVISVSPTSKGWDVQLPLAGKVGAGTYTARAFIKVTAPKAGYGVRFAIYSPAAHGCPFEKVIKITEIPLKTTYQWVDLGEITVPDDDKAYLFIASAGDNSFESFFIKSIELYPINK
ncbi:MAG: hypothetical protein L3J71_08240 [Victivallaceae bacterium]|nr:hypothetical protein [Victivallaceae bacterium]